MKLKLIDNWREAWRWYSIWAFTSIGTIQTSVMIYITPEQLTSPVLFYPEWTWATAAQAAIAFLAITGGIGRMIAQPPKPAEQQLQQ